MDPPLTPPHRIQVLTTVPESDILQDLQKFLDEFQARGGNTAVTVQLQKLTDALKQEQKKKKKKNPSKLAFSPGVFDSCQLTRTLLLDSIREVVDF